MSKRCTNPKMMAHPEQCKGICEQCDDYKEQPELQWRCPQCHHIANAHNDGGCFSQEGCACKMTREEILKYREPEYHCPLREKEQIELLDLMCKGNVEGLEPVEVTKLISLWYRWYKEQKQVHDAEMRQEFAKECTKVQPDIDVPPNFKKYTDEYFIYCQGANDYWETVKAHIREIAGKEPQ